MISEYRDVRNRVRTRYSRALTITAVLLCSMACAHAPAPALTLPLGAGTFARDGALAIQQVTNACVDPVLGRPTGSLITDVSASGTIGSRRIDAVMRAAIASGLRIEVPNGRGAVAVLAVSPVDKTATLLVPGPRSDSVFRAPSFEAILQRLVALSVDPAALLRIVSGCYLPEPFGYVSEYGEQWRRISGGRGGNVYAYRESLAVPWRMAALYYPGQSLRPQWRLDYLDYQDGYARTLHLTSEESRVDVTFRIVNLDPRPSLPATMFSIDVPPTAQEKALSALNPL